MLDHPYQAATVRLRRAAPPHPFAGLQPAHYCEQQSIRLRTHASQTNFTRVPSATATAPTSIDLRASIRFAAAQSPNSDRRSSGTQARSISTPSSIFSVPTLEAFRATRRPPERHSGHK